MRLRYFARLFYFSWGEATKISVLNRKLQPGDAISAGYGSDKGDEKMESGWERSVSWFEDTGSNSWHDEGLWSSVDVGFATAAAGYVNFVFLFDCIACGKGCIYTKSGRGMKYKRFWAKIMCFSSQKVSMVKLGRTG